MAFNVKADIEKRAGEQMKKEVPHMFSSKAKSISRHAKSNSKALQGKKKPETEERKKENYYKIIGYK